MGSKKDDEDILALPSSSSNDDDDFVKLLAESPVLFFVLSHKAVEIELAQIRGVAVEALDNGGEVVDQLCSRLHFLKLVYKYHCAAEDEVNIELCRDYNFFLLELILMH